MSNPDPDRLAMNRRSVLQALGTTAGLAGLVGTASARPHAFQFFGCSQVCTDTSGNYAVVATDDGYECRPIHRSSDRNNVAWDHSVTYCYEADGDEAIVGALQEDVRQGHDIDYSRNCTLCLNPNRCASNYYDSASEVAEALDESYTCGRCKGNVVEGECTVYGSSGKRPDNETHGKKDEKEYEDDEDEKEYEDDEDEKEYEDDEDEDDDDRRRRGPPPWSHGKRGRRWGGH
jgi:hypothetical protein